MLVVFGLGLGFWQYRTNLATRAQLAAQQAQLEKAQANTVAELSDRSVAQRSTVVRCDLPSAARLDLLQGRNAVATVILAPLSGTLTGVSTCRVTSPL
jgi:hypothetical protein